MLDDIRSNGDSAVRKYSEQFDKLGSGVLPAQRRQVAKIVSDLPTTVIDDLSFVQRQVRNFAQAQRDSMLDVEIETLPGVRLGHKHVPVSASGAYVPGGRYPLTASAHMTVVTAKVAGVERVAATTPPNPGSAPPISVAAMHLAGADEIYVLGGVQAIGALALGTETIAPVNLLTGPGNAYVAEAKRQMFGEVGIDLFAGPTEVLIVADDTADPFIVAADLLSQAEHGPDSPVVLVTTSERVGRETIAEVSRQLVNLPTSGVAAVSWENFGEVHVVDNLEEAFALADRYASEHVQILTAEPRRALTEMHDYGALFLGEKTCVSYGDKAIGTNHVLPHSGAARLHRRAVGRQVPQDGHLPGDRQRRVQRGAGPHLWSRCATGELRGARAFGGRASGEVRRRRSSVDRSRSSHADGRRGCTAGGETMRVKSAAGADAACGGPRRVHRAGPR